MHPASEAIKVELLPRCEAKEGAAFTRDPNFITRNVPHPHAKFGSVRSELHPLLRLAQLSLARLQPSRELRCTEHVIAQFVAHRRDNCRICETKEKRNVDNSPNHEWDVPCHNRAENHAATDNQSASPVASAPYCNRGIDEKDKQQ
jgi:hypothetical protein